MSKNRCEFCESSEITKSTKTEIFIYGAGLDAVELTASVPVIYCSSCGESYADGEAELSRHDAVCRHLGRLTPEEIREIRRGYGLTQRELASLTGIGEASIKRWELGNQIQNSSCDNLLRLVRLPNNYRLLIDKPTNDKQQFKYRTKIDDRVVRESQSFKLRCVAVRVAA